MDAPISEISTSDLIDRITELAGHLNAANARWLALIAEFDRRRAWAEWGVKSCAHWLNWKCGLGLVRRGKSCVPHTLWSVCHASPGRWRGKAQLLEGPGDDAGGGALERRLFPECRKLVRSYRRATESQELSREAAQQRDQSLCLFHESDGSLSIKGKLPAEVGALFIKALQAAEDAGRPKDVSAGTFSDTCPTTGARRVAALSRIAESFLASGDQEISGGDRNQIVVHVGVETLQHDHTGRCELEEGPSIAAETARRLSCDASVISIFENEKGEPLNVGRRTRTIPPAIRRALNSRDRGCRFPGCTFTRYVDGHHVKHWAHGGETKLSNMVTLCRFHHRQVHEGRVVVASLDDGAFRFTTPNGQTFDSPQPPAASWQDLMSNQPIRITSATAITGWSGETLDVDHTVDWLMQRAQRMENVSAETLVP